MNTQKQALDFVAIGDIVTDAFIQLDADARILPGEGGGVEQLCVNFGDKVEYEDVTVVKAVGNSPNAATSATRLGLATGLVTFLGDDTNGDDCLAQLKDYGISTEFVTTQKGQKTNYHYVLRHGAERTILIKHYEYDYKLPTFAMPPRWMYLSSMGENSLAYHHEIATFIKEHPETKLAFQPGTFHIRLGVDTFKDLYAVTDILFCNKEEAQQILNSTEQNILTLLTGLRSIGPKMAIITDGPNGAFAQSADGTWRVPMYPDIAKPVDRTGAGDAFSSTVTAMLALGMSLPEALLRGPINSMNVVQHIGAQEGLLNIEAIHKYLADAPNDYIITEI